MAITDGTAFELIDHPEKLDDKKVSVLLGKMIVSVLKQWNNKVVISIQFNSTVYLYSVYTQ